MLISHIAIHKQFINSCFPSRPALNMIPTSINNHIRKPCFQIISPIFINILFTAVFKALLCPISSLLSLYEFIIREVCEDLIYIFLIKNSNYKGEVN